MTAEQETSITKEMCNTIGNVIRMIASDIDEYDEDIANMSMCIMVREIERMVSDV